MNLVYIIMVLVVCFLAVSFMSYNPYTSTIIFGKKGTGKTTYMAKLALKYHRKGWKVYSSSPIAYAQTFDPLLLTEYTFPKNSVILVDEVGLVWNNRDFKNFDKRLTEFFKYLRQYRLKIYMFSQAFDVDKKIRDTMDYIYIAKRFGDFGVLRGISKIQGIGTDSDGMGQLVDTYAYNFFDIKITYLPRYYGLFNSYNPPNRPVVEHRLYYDVVEYFSWTNFLKMKFNKIIKSVLYFVKLLYYDVIFIEAPCYYWYNGVLVPETNSKKGWFILWLKKLFLN